MLSLSSLLSPTCFSSFSSVKKWSSLPAFFLALPQDYKTIKIIATIIISSHFVRISHNNNSNSNNNDNNDDDDDKKENATKKNSGKSGHYWYHLVMTIMMTMSTTDRENATKSTRGKTSLSLLPTHCPMTAGKKGNGACFFTSLQTSGL